MYEFKLVDTDIANATRSEWLKQLSALDGVVPPSPYLMKLDWAQKHANGRNDKNTFLYALCRKETPLVACAFLDVSYALPKSDGAWLKVLSIHVEPELDTMGNNDIKTLAKIASTSLIEALGLTFNQHPCNRLKVYGTTPLTLDFLEGISSQLSDSHGFDVVKQGAWLVIDK